MEILAWETPAGWPYAGGSRVAADPGMSAPNIPETESDAIKEGLVR
jgi:hypothetical protein